MLMLLFRGLPAKAPPAHRHRLNESEGAVAMPAKACLRRHRAVQIVCPPWMDYLGALGKNIHDHASLASKCVAFACIKALHVEALLACEGIACEGIA